MIALRNLKFLLGIGKVGYGLLTFIGNGVVLSNIEPAVRNVYFSPELIPLYFFIISITFLIGKASLL